MDEDALAVAFTEALGGVWRPGLPSLGSVALVRAGYWLVSDAPYRVYLHVVMHRGGGAEHAIERKAIIVQRWRASPDDRLMGNLLGAGRPFPTLLEAGSYVRLNGLLCDWWDPRG